MCASYGLTSETRQRRKAEQSSADEGLFALLEEPEVFDEKVDPRIFPESLDRWLEDHEEPAF